ncbi:MAG: nicotinamide-nucleotide amidohydrolase family protein [Chloroflexi bacterium]|nr:nicotinamide-nucleotide amidohydrolase family protein [Chloroflexota bacterium]
MDELLEVVVGRLLSARGLTIATAESCTGGLVAHRLTNVAGSSNYLLGGAVTYSNGVKQNLLGVPAETLVTHGAVSEQTALAMAQGARRLFGVDIAVSTTGVAGPGGGTPQKPVGLVFIGLAAEGYATVEQHVWPHDRSGNKEASAEAALALVRRYLESGGASSHADEVDAEPTLAEVDVAADGAVRPQAFMWRGARQNVTSVGRQWVDDAGRHVLVMTARGTYELIGALAWHVRPVSSNPAVA